MIRTGCFSAKEMTTQAAKTSKKWPWFAIPSVHTLKYYASLLRASQSVNLIVKIIAFLAICCAIWGVCLNYAQAKSRDEMLSFWRSVFMRPGLAEIKLKIDATAELTTLGGRLFIDPRMSGSRTRACVTCHQVKRGFTDGLEKAQGLDGAPLKRNTPTLFNLAWGKAFNLDGSAPNLEQQALGPIQNTNELGGDFKKILERLNTDPEMRKLFETAFPGAPRITKQSILTALSAYERSLIAPMTAFDSWIDGELSALTDQERAGFQLFVGKGGCVACHVGWRMTDDGFHDIGLPVTGVKVTSRMAGKRGVFSFKTPTLRSVKLTAPYMHDGSLKSLADVVDHYADNVVARRGVSELLQPKIDLSAEERSALIAFLNTL